MEQDGIKLARRSSGGGAVFHDVGNTCFTFMSGKPGYDKSISTRIILAALAQVGIIATASGRNDLVVTKPDGERKISGSAYRETKDRGFHHGTLLLNADLSRLANYLNPDVKKLQAKGITSVRARVANLVELLPNIDHQRICDAITASFFSYYGERCAAELISPQQAPDLPGFSEQFARQSSWAWNFGQAPDFTHQIDTRFPWGGIELHLDIDRGVIARSQIFTDSLNPTPFEALALSLQGCDYRSQNVSQVGAALMAQFPEQKSELQQVTQWLAENIR